MPRYIDADELKNAFTNWREIVNNPYDFFPSVEECKAVIDAQPTAEVVEIKRGRWIAYGLEDGFAIERHICSECDYDIGVIPTNYCPNCGAKMDEDDTYCTEENCETFLRDLNCERCQK